MDRKTKNLYELVADGDDTQLQQVLLEGKEERNAATLAHGNTVLHEASWKGYSRCVKVLCNIYPKDSQMSENSKEKLEAKKNRFINRVNFCGFSALHLAAQNGHNQTLRELLYAGCNTTIHNDYGDTPLHTACRYGHAGVVRILISAKCDADAFNLNHDTPLHITCAMGRRKLTKLLLEAGAMQFQNLQHETPRDIAQRKNLCEILEILSTHVDKKLQREAKKCKSPTKTAQGHAHHLLPHNSKLKNINNDPNQKDSRNWSPYGCHYYPDTRNFPQPKLESLPKEPLAKGEQYYIDLGGNIRKGPIGTGNTCYCAPLFKEAISKNCKNVRRYADKANEKLDKRVAALAKQIEKTKHNKSLLDEDNDHRSLDVDYYDEEEMGLEAINKIRDENKQMHLEKWLRRVYAGAANTNSDPPQSPQSSDINKTPEIMVSSISHHKKTDKDRINSNEKPQHQHRISALVHQSSFSKMPIYDENGNHDRIHVDNQQQKLYNDDGNQEDDDSYTDIDDDDDDCSNSLSRKSCNSDGQQNALYDESFLRNFQHQQQHQQQFYQNSIQNDSLTSPSINSNQNIELEMDRITKSLMLINSSAPDKELHFRTPDVLTDHYHQQHQIRQRSDLEIKSAVTKPTPTAAISSSSILTSGDLYVNSYFNTINNNNNNHNDIISSPTTPEMMREQQQTIVNASNICSNSSTQKYIQKLEVTHDMVSSLAIRKEPMYDNLLGSGSISAVNNNQFWNGAGRVRNPLNIQEIEKYTENIFNNHSEESTSIATVEHPVETSLNGNNFVLLDKLMKARKQLNHSYQQQLEMLHNQGQHQLHQPPTIPSHYIKGNNDEINDYSVGASSLV
ncbi:unnamed protein product [Diamesa hyperborea]